MSDMDRTAIHEVMEQGRSGSILFLRLYYIYFRTPFNGCFFSFLTLQLKYFKSNVRKVCCRLGPNLFEVWSLKFFSVPRRIRNFPQNLNHVKAGVNLGLSFLFLLGWENILVGRSEWEHYFHKLNIYFLHYELSNYFYVKLSNCPVRMS